MIWCAATAVVTPQPRASAAWAAATRSAGRVTADLCAGFALQTVTTMTEGHRFARSAQGRLTRPSVMCCFQSWALFSPSPLASSASGATRKAVHCRRASAPRGNGTSSGALIDFYVSSSLAQPSCLLSGGTLSKYGQRGLGSEGTSKSFSRSLIELRLKLGSL